MSKKPTGDDGPVHFDGQGGARWEKITFSHVKSEVEQQFFDFWRQLMKQELGIDVAGTQNVEDDFDFTVTRPDGTINFMDLMEIVPPVEKGSPYTTSSDWRGTGEMTNHIVEGVLKKSDRYGRGVTTPVDLLIYATHAEFTLSPADIAGLLPTKLSRAPPFMFREIWYVSLLDPDHGVGGKVWPVDPGRLLSEEELDRIEKAKTIVLHPSQMIPR